MVDVELSVVIPAYRAATTIGRALDSALAQTRPPDEIIVVDDGSPDDLAAVVARYGPRVRLIRKANGGVASARNVGIDRASGRLLAFLDADDYWEPHKLERQLAVLEANPEIGIIGAHLFLEPPDAARRPDPAIDARLFDRVLWLAGEAAFVAACNLWTGTVVVRRAVLGDARFDEQLTTAEDRDLWLRVLLRAGAYLVGEPLATAVQTPGSLSRSDIARDARNMLVMIDRYRELLGPSAHARWVTDVHRRWSGRLLSRGEGRAALGPALTRLRRAPSSEAVWIVAKSAAIATGTPRPVRRAVARVARLARGLLSRRRAGTARTARSRRPRRRRRSARRA